MSQSRRSSDSSSSRSSSQDSSSQSRSGRRSRRGPSRKKSNSSSQPPKSGSSTTTRSAQSDDTRKTRSRRGRSKPAPARSSRSKPIAKANVDASADKPTFEELGLGDDSLAAIRSKGFESPSPIQAAFIPLALSGSDATGQARTGTGKTAAFVLPILERIDLERKVVQAIVLAPTRELSEQVAEEARSLAQKTPCRTVTVVGGRPIRGQMQKLADGAQLVVGTPGRVIDLLGRGHLKLDAVSIVVLDEADRMLDIGFRPDIEKILRRCPTERQTLLLSATMPPPVERLARNYMRDPQRVDLSDDQIAANDVVEQFYITVDEDRKFPLLVRLLKDQRPQQVLVFTRTKRGAERLHKKFAGKLKRVEMIHGDLVQRKRDRVLRQFREGEVRMLIATDVVGRGIDISGISHIVNYDIPEFCDDYIHRIGRTGRLSSDEEGRAFTFVRQDQGKELTQVEKRINIMIPEYHIEGFVPCRSRREVETVKPVERPVIEDFYIEDE